MTKRPRHRSLAAPAPPRPSASVGRVARRAVLAAVLITMAALLLLAPAGGTAGAQGAPGAPRVDVVELDGTIDNVTARFLSRALRQAGDDGAELVVVRLDTPGGLVSAMRDMVSDIFESRVPVVVYVAPEGARAASAGTFITAAGGVAAMAPATNIGAASVVGGQGEDLPETLERKATQDAAALLRSIADRRGRNSEALEAAVFEARSYSANEALQLGVIDLVADDLDDLLAQLDGREIPARGGAVTVRTGGAELRFVELNFFERVLAFLSDPTITFLLVTLGALAIMVEIFNFGAVVPGVLGISMLVLGFAGLGQLPFSWAGVAMIGLAMALFVAEVNAPGFGFFGIAGLIALVLGGLFLVGFFGTPALPDAPRFRVNRWVIASTGVLAALVVGLFAWQVRQAQHLPGYLSPLRRDAMIGRVGRVSGTLDPIGEIHVAGEFWRARLVAGETADVGTDVRVVDATGFELCVEPVADGDRAEGQDREDQPWRS
jgi:membrane-bound serine protease (ClpP class)